MSKAKMFRHMRGIDDKTLGGVLTNHAGTLRAVANATTLLLRERRLMLVWAVVVTVVLTWLVLHAR